jgi:hypothetical protein
MGSAGNNSIPQHTTHTLDVTRITNSLTLTNLYGILYVIVMRKPIILPRGYLASHMWYSPFDFVENHAKQMEVMSGGPRSYRKKVRFLDLGYRAGECGMHGLRLRHDKHYTITWIHVGNYDVRGRYPDYLVENHMVDGFRSGGHLRCGIM